MKSESGHSGRRRHHDRAFKAKLVQQCLEPGASVSAIALEHGINANMLFTWRRAWLRESAAASRSATETTLLPVRLEPQQPVAAIVNTPKPAVPTGYGLIELEIAGAKLRLRGNVQEDSLRAVLRALREAA